MSEQRKNYVLVINDAPANGERPYNALRLAVKLVGQPKARVRVFLLGEGVECARARGEAPEDLARIARMIGFVALRAEVFT